MMTETATPTAFIPGQPYVMRSPCDYNCIWTCTVVARTANQLTLKVSGYEKPVRKGVKVYDGVEQCSPLGTFSMSPVLRANKLA